MASRYASAWCAWSGRTPLLRLFRGSFVAPNTRNYGTRQESKQWKQKPNRKARLAIILTEDVSNLGSKGHIVKVKHGYARNYLLPRNMAVYATPDNIKLYDAKVVEKTTRSAVDPVNFFSEFLSGKVLTIKREPETKWAVFEQDIATTVLKQYQVHVPLDRIELADPIVSFGEYTVDVRLDESTIVTIPVKAVPLVPKQQKKPGEKLGLQQQELIL